MARSKYEQLRETFDALQSELATVKDATVAELRGAWAKAQSQVDAAIAKGIAAPSDFAAGFEQALLEFPSLVSPLSVEVRRKALAAFQRSLSAHYPRFLTEQEARLLKILRRGSIRSESEFYLVRQRIDELEALSKTKELSELYALVDQFEGKGGA